MSQFRRAGEGVHPSIRYIAKLEGPMLAKYRGAGPYVATIDPLSGEIFGLREGGDELWPEDGTTPCIEIETAKFISDEVMEVVCIGSATELLIREGSPAAAALLVMLGV